MTVNANSTPTLHVGFIMDGNRRWLRQNGITKTVSYAAGYKAMKEVLYECFEQGVTHVSIYAFSSENWKRDESEIAGLMQLVPLAVAKDLQTLVDRGVRVCFLGCRDRLSDDIMEAIEKSEQATRELTNGTLAVCFNYGGKQEIVDAVRACIADGLSEDAITEDAIAERLYAPDVPPVDLIVRTSGERRLSNFMLWRSAYSEFLFLEKHWPDMTKDDVTAIIEEYNRRSRRFGG